MLALIYAHTEKRDRDHRDRTNALRDRLAGHAIDGEGPQEGLADRDAWVGEALRELDSAPLQAEPPAIQPDLGIELDLGP